MEKFNSALDAFLYWAEHTPDKLFLSQPVNGEIKKYTYRQGAEEIKRIAGAIQDYNLPVQSKIALLSKNCAHWMLADLAIMMTGHISVPIYPTLNAQTINHILVHSESAAIILGKLDNYQEQKAGIPDIHKIGVGLYGETDGTLWEDIVSIHGPIEEIAKQAEESMTSIIYTSGTTGHPKGAMHTIGNFTRMGNLCLSIFNNPNPARFFSFLPLSHIAERVGIEIHGYFQGVSFFFPENIDTFAADLEAAQPHLFFAVPRLWAKFQEKIIEKMSQKKLDTLLAIPFVSKLIKQKLKTKLGLAEATYIFSGAAPISTSLLDWYKKIGLTIFQAYGMTEDCLYSHFNLPGANKVGTVGKPLPGGKVRLSPEGEICLKNSCLMKGYYKEPQLTAAMFDDDGYLKTGDIGEFDHEGYLTITGRIKDQFKTDKGKYIAPAPIEVEFMKNSDIDQICIVGTGIPQPIALIVLSDSGKMKSREDLIISFEQMMETINFTLENHEKIEKAVIMKESWSIDNGLLTPTFKVKRTQIEKIHHEFYPIWFHKEEKVIFEAPCT